MTKIKRLWEAFDTPREWLAWLLLIVPTVFVVTGHFDPEHWIGAVVISATLQGWISRVQAGPVKIGDHSENETPRV